MGINQCNQGVSWFFTKPHSQKSMQPKGLFHLLPSAITYNHSQRGYSNPAESFFFKQLLISYEKDDALQEPGSPSLNPSFRNLSIKAYPYEPYVQCMYIALFTLMYHAPLYGVVRSAVIRFIHTIPSKIKSDHLRAIWRFSLKVSSTAIAHHRLCMSQRLKTSLVQWKRVVNTLSSEAQNQDHCSAGPTVKHLCVTRLWNASNYTLLRLASSPVTLIHIHSELAKPQM